MINISFIDPVPDPAGLLIPGTTARLHANVVLAVALVGV